MGYTNYWRQPSDFTDTEWTKIKNEADYLRSWSSLDQTKNFIEVEIKKDEICIYGPCETMVLNKKARTKPRYEGDDVAFHFCKTREQLYDLAVWHLLSVCFIIKSDFTISRDNHSFAENNEPEKAVVNG